MKGATIMCFSFNHRTEKEGILMDGVGNDVVESGKTGR
jgi:hypothetical protein